jgi:hypothetical protein
LFIDVLPGDKSKKSRFCCRESCFSSDQAPYIMERHWRESQKFQPQDDGRVVMEPQIANLWEVKRWLIEWGADAAVLSLVPLVEDIRKEIRMLRSLEAGVQE